MRNGHNDKQCFLMIAMLATNRSAAGSAHPFAGRDVCVAICGRFIFIPGAPPEEFELGEGDAVLTQSLGEFIAFHFVNIADVYRLIGPYFGPAPVVGVKRPRPATFAQKATKKKERALRTRQISTNSFANGAASAVTGQLLPSAGPTTRPAAVAMPVSPAPAGKEQSGPPVPTATPAANPEPPISTAAALSTLKPVNPAEAVPGQPAAMPVSPAPAGKEQSGPPVPTATPAANPEPPTRALSTAAAASDLPNSRATMSVDRDVTKEMLEKLKDTGESTNGAVPAMCDFRARLRR
jgi:hypothetical protein